MAGGHAAARAAETTEVNEADAPSSATLRAVEHALDEVETGAGPAEPAKSPDRSKPAVLTSPLAGGANGSMSTSAGPNTAGPNPGAPVASVGQHYWIDQSGTVIGTSAQGGDQIAFGAPPPGPDGWVDPRMMAGIQQGQVNANMTPPAWMQPHMMGQQHFDQGQQHGGAPPHGHEHSGAPPSQAGQGSQAQQQPQMGMMFSPQYPQQFQQQWMSPENYQFQQMYPQHFQQQWLPEQFSGGGGGGGSGGSGYNRGGRRNYGRGGGRGGGYHDRDNEQNVQMFGRDAQDVPWSELVGSIAEFTMTQHGSIALQARIDSAGSNTSDYVSTALKELAGSLADAMTNKYGSHLTRRIVELCSKAERTAIVREIAAQIVGISRSRFGTWTVQKLVESLDSDDQISILKEQLKDQVVEMTKCPNGNHVIKYCLQTMTPADNQFIYEALTHDIMDIARHKYGCSMLQRCLDYATEEQARLVSDRVAMDAMPLIEDAFGNYIVQYVLELGFEESSVAIVDQMIGSFVRLSREKFGSNVVEKCVAKPGSESLQACVREVLVPGQLEMLVTDPFGNYVVQSMLENSSDDEVKQMGERIKGDLLDHVTRTVYGKRIRQKLQRRLPDMFPRQGRDRDYDDRGQSGGGSGRGGYDGGHRHGRGGGRGRGRGRGRGGWRGGGGGSGGRGGVNGGNHQVGNQVYDDQHVALQPGWNVQGQGMMQPGHAYGGYDAYGYAGGYAMQHGVIPAPQPTMHQIQFGAVPGPSPAAGVGAEAPKAVQNELQHPGAGDTFPSQGSGGTGHGASAGTRPDGGNASGTPPPGGDRDKP